MLFAKLGPNILSKLSSKKLDILATPVAIDACRSSGNNPNVNVLIKPTVPAAIFRVEGSNPSFCNLSSNLSIALDILMAASATTAAIPANLKAFKRLGPNVFARPEVRPDHLEAILAKIVGPAATAAVSVVTVAVVTAPVARLVIDWVTVDDAAAIAGVPIAAVIALPMAFPIIAVPAPNKALVRTGPNIRSAIFHLCSSIFSLTMPNILSNTIANKSLSAGPNTAHPLRNACAMGLR